MARRSTSMSCLSGASLPMGFASIGLIMGAFPDVEGVAPNEAYRAMFGFLAGVVLLALLNYLRLPDARPSEGFAEDLQSPTPLP